MIFKIIFIKIELDIFKYCFFDFLFDLRFMFLNIYFLLSDLFNLLLDLYNFFFTICKFLFNLCYKQFFRLKHLYPVVKCICNQYPALFIYSYIPRVLKPSRTPAKTSKFSDIGAVFFIDIYSMTHIIHYIHSAISIINS